MKYTLLLFVFITCNQQTFSSGNAPELAIDSKLEVVPFYQKFNYDESTDCNCAEKTERDFKLAERLLHDDILNYNFLSYDIELGTKQNAIQKLYFALKEDSQVVKLSFIEWSKLTIVFKDGFDRSSFELAAVQTFSKITPSDVSEFLWQKNKELKTVYDHKINKLQNQK